MILGVAHSLGARAATTESAPVAPPGAPVYETDIRPLLKAHCFDCHGEGDSLKGGLDLRLRRFMVRGGESGPALVPGDPEASLLYRLVTSGEMPKRDRKPTGAEIERLRRWIEAGAPTAREEPEALAAGMQITAEEQAHWAFQPVRRPPVPRASGALASRVRTPVDAFVAASLTREGLGFSADAPRRALIRRVYLDLWGVPPAPDEVDAFVADPAPEAYERLVDRLLASPRYGERWGRHWLDVAGYADSDGYTHDDAPRPHAFKYRDYVIASMNADLPLDRFLAEQLAGDELALQRHPTLESAAQDPETRSWLVATGFLRMAADGTASGGIDQDTARNQVMADTLKIVSSSLLGLTVGCAQCHDHRYDPIPQADYYRLRAIFEPAYDWKKWRTPAERRVSLATVADRQRAAEVEAEAVSQVAEREALQTRFIDEALRQHLDEKFEPALREPLWVAFHTPAKQRTDAQNRLLKEHPSANIHAGVLYQYHPKAADALKVLDAKIAEIRSRKPVEDFIAVLSEPGGEAPVTRRFHRGDPGQPREARMPGTLSVLPGGGKLPGWDAKEDTAGPTSGRRLALARWLVSDANPLTARVLVNRIWMHHFGKGLVGTPGDFGMQGERPTHPELLDWLATTLATPAGESGNGREAPGLGWSLKGLHRLLLRSTTYRQASGRHPAGDAVDADNRWYWRMPVQRLDGEALRDSMLSVSGLLSGRLHGEPVPVREDVVGQVVVGIDRKVGDNKMPVDVPMGEDEFRRSVYVEVRRSKPLAFLNVFDAPVMEVNCERRQVSTVAPQSLMMLNSEFALQQARRLAERVFREAGPSREARVERAWRLAYGRAPGGTELAGAVRFLDEQATLMTVPGGTAAAEAPSRAALGALCQVLLGSNEFLYLD